MPVLPGVTEEAWVALINKRPAEIPRKEWSTFVLTSFEVGAGRAIPSARLKAAAATAEKAKVSASFVKKLKDAELESLQLEATKQGREKIASQEPLKFAQPGRAVLAAPATAVAERAPAKAHATTKTHAPAVAVAKAKAAAGAPGGEDAAYAKIVESVHSGKPSPYSYGKLNFAYEIARRKNDEISAAEIKGAMLKLRPLITVPGRYGITDAEYKNYAMVHKTHDAGDEVPAAALAAAHKTALKLGHHATADEWLAQLPAAPARAKAPAVAAKAPAKAPSKAGVVAKVAVPAAATAAVVAAKVPTSDHRGVPAAIWKKLPPPPSAEITVPDWQTYAMVHYFVGTKHAVPTNDELWTASLVATKVGKKDRARIYRGLMSDSPAATKFDGLEAAKSTKPASTWAASKITEEIIVDASKSSDPKVLRTAAGVAKDMGHQKTYTQLMAKADKLSPGGAAVAAKAGVPTGKIVATKTDIPEGVSKREWNFFTTTVKKVSAKHEVPVEEIDHAKHIADQIGYKGTSMQLARAAADVRHRQAVAARSPKPIPKAPVVAARTPAPKGGGVPLAAKVAIPAGVAVATVATVEATRAPSPAPAPKPGADMRPPPVITTAAMVPPETIASVPVTPNKSTVEAAAKATGVSPAAVAEQVLDAKNDKGDARERVATASDLNRRLSSSDKPTMDVAREELRDLQQKKSSGDDEAQKRLVELAAAAAAATVAAAALTAAAKAHHEAGPAATPSEVVVAAKVAAKGPQAEAESEKRGRVEAPQASIAGPSEGPGVGTLIAGVGLVGMGIFVLANKKKGAAAR